MTDLFKKIAKAITALVTTFAVTELGLDADITESLVSSAIVALFTYAVPNDDQQKIEDAVNDVLARLDEYDDELH